MHPADPLIPGYEERLKVARSMQQFGGSFTQALGEALLKADSMNATRIRYAFPEYWEKYLNWPEEEEGSGA